MKLTNKTFFLTFSYITYFAFLFNSFISNNINDFLNHFSTWGIVYSFNIICFFNILYLNNKLTDSYPFVQEIKKLNNYIGLLLFLNIILSHLMVNHFNLYGIFNKLSNILNINQFAIQFFILFGLIINYIWMLKKTIYKKIIFLSGMVLFIHCFYYIFLYISFTQQSNLYEKVYISASENNIYLKECYEKDKINCISLDRKNLVQLKQEQNSNLNKQINNSINKIIESKEKTFVLSYPSIFIFTDNNYKPIIVHNNDTNLLIIDYNSLNTILNEHTNVYLKITAIASIFWLFFMQFLYWIHHLVKINYFNFLKNKT